MWNSLGSCYRHWNNQFNVLVVFSHKFNDIFFLLVIQRPFYTLLSPHILTTILYVGLSQSLSGLQVVQNAAMRFLTVSKKTESITPALASLHWLPMKYRIDFMILLLFF